MVPEVWHPVRQFIETDSVAYGILSYPVSYPIFSVYKLQTLLAESVAKRATDHFVKHVVKPIRRLFIEKHKTVLYVLESSRQKAWERSHVVN